MNKVYPAQFMLHSVCPRDIFHHFLMCFQPFDHGESNTPNVVAKEVTDNGLKKCGLRLFDTLIEHYRINSKVFSPMLVAVISNTDSSEL